MSDIGNLFLLSVTPLERGWSVLQIFVKEQTFLLGGSHCRGVDLIMLGIDFYLVLTVED